jgi:hypothetical protein
MAKIKPEPIVLIDTTVTIKVKGSTAAADNYEDYFNRSELVYSPGSAVTYQGGTKDATYTFPTPGTWNWEVTTPQDFDKPDGLSRFLWAHRGEDLEVVIAPKAGGTSWAFDCTAPLGVGVGGTIGAVAQNTLGFPLKGEPVPTFPTAS